jgi:polysaccharide biosynthesis protein PslH
MNNSQHSLRLLFLTPFAPSLEAAFEGERLMSLSLAEMVSRHQAAIVYLRSPNEPPIDDYFLDRCMIVQEIPRPVLGTTFFHRLERSIQVARSLAIQRPIRAGDWWSPDFAQKARSMAIKFKPDIIQAEYHIMGQYYYAFKGMKSPRVLVSHEPGLRAAPYMQVGPPVFRRAIQALEKGSWKRFESQVMRQAQAVVTFTEVDRRILLPLANKVPVYRIAPGIQIPAQPLDPLGTSQDEILFVGSFHHPANVEAAVRLIYSIFPLVQQKVPQARLTIVGEAPPPEIQRAADGKILVTGKVPDVRPYLDRAAVFAAPIRSGGGIRVKVMEALAYGKAIVATRLAAEGLDVEDGCEISLAESDSELAHKITWLLAYEDRRGFLATRGRSWAVKHLQLEKSIRAYEALYKKLLDRNANHG